MSWHAKYSRRHRNCQGENNLIISVTAKVRCISNAANVGSNPAETGFMVNMFNLGPEWCH